MIPRPPEPNETPLSPSEAAYLTYGNETSNNPVSVLFQRNEHQGAEQCFQPAVPTMRGPSDSVHPAIFKHLKSGKVRALQGRDSGFGLLWFGRTDHPQVGEVGNVGLEGK